MSYAVESLESRRLLAVTVPQPIQNQTFAQDTQPVAADLFSFFEDPATLQPDLTFTATSDNPALVSAQVTNGSIINLSFAAGASGFAHVRIVGTDPSGNNAADVFRVQITAATSRSLDVSLGAARRSLTFTGPNKAPALISLAGPGSAVVHFGGDALKLVGNTVKGSNQELESITLSGTTAATTLDIRGRPHRGLFPAIGSISTDGDLGALKIKGAVLEGDATAKGGLSRVEVDFANTGIIAAGSSTIQTTLKFAFFADESFASAAPVTSITGTRWSNTDAATETFAAAYIRRLIVVSDFSPGVQLTGKGAPGLTLGRVRIGGAVGGNWTVTGPSAPLTIGAAVLDWHASFDSLPSITDFGFFDGQLTTPSLKFLKVRGPMIDAVLSLTASGAEDLGQLRVDGGISLSFVSAAGSIGSVLASQMLSSQLFAGGPTVPQGDVLPATASDFSTSASIGSITLHPRRGAAFVDSRIAASTLGTLSLDTAQTANAGKPFGIAARQIGRLTARDLTRPQTIHLTNVRDPAMLAAQVAAEKLTLADLVIRVV